MVKVYLGYTGYSRKKVYSNMCPRMLRFPDTGFIIFVAETLNKDSVGVVSSD